MRRYLRQGRRLLASALAGALASGAAAAPPPASDLDARIDPIFAAYTSSGPGCAVGVERAGTVLFSKGYGAADVTTGRAFSPATPTYMASVSKQVAAMAALLLVEEGRLSLADPVRKFIPELPDYADHVTVAQLLNHTSGLRDYFTLGVLDGVDPDHPFTEADVLRMLARQRGLNFAPGADFLYSNSGYVLVAMIVQRVSGQRLDDFARYRIFTPLGMTHSRFQHDHTADIPGRAHGYESVEGQWAISDSHLDVVGDGGLYSSVDDMLRWLTNLDRPIVGAKALVMMRASGHLTDGSPSGYGMGLETSIYRGHELVQHGGALAGYRTSDLWFPNERLGVVVLCNRADARPSELAAQVADVFLPADAPSYAAAIAPTAGDVTQFAGLYRNDKGAYVSFAVRDGSLVALDPDQPLAQVEAGRFVAKANPNGAAMVFEGKDEVAIVREGKPTLVYHRVTRSDRVADAGAYVGVYVSAETVQPLHLRQGASGVLTLSVGDGPAAPLTETGPDRLWMPAFGVEAVFVRGSGGLVTGLSLNAGRARGLVYVKRPG